MYKRWTLETMNNFCVTCANGYSVIETKHIQKPYQKQLWALVKCPNEFHKPYWACWNNFKRGDRCKECYHEDNRIMNWDKDKAYEFCLINGYKMLNKDDFKDVDNQFYCYDKNNFIVKLSISNLKRYLSNKYNISGFSIIKNNEYAKYNIDLYCKLYRPEYEFISNEYLGVKKLHWFKYNGEFINGNIFNRDFQCTVDCFINGNVSHPNINKSSGEIYIENLLIQYNISYIPQHTFKNCKDKQVLPFDFYLPDYNMIIEYNGKQHYEPIDFFGGVENYKYIQKHDKIKYDYCIKNQIKTLYIPYTLTKDEIIDKIQNILNP